MLKYNKKIKKKGNPVEVQTTQALMGDQSKRKQLFTIKAKFFCLSHDVVTCDVDRDVSAAY